MRLNTFYLEFTKVTHKINLNDHIQFEEQDIFDEWISKYNNILAEVYEYQSNLEYAKTNI